MTDPAEVLVGIEADRGPWVVTLIAVGYTVYPVNPLQASSVPAVAAMLGVDILSLVLAP